MEILTSTDPKDFKLSKHNRLVDLHKAEKLAVAMRKNNLLPYYPIVVNKQMEVLDGQHRLEAAKLSDSVIYFIISDEGYDIMNVAETNALHTRWKLQDYIKYFSSLGYDDYTKLYTYMNKWELPFTTILKLLSGKNTRASKLIRDGFFKITDEEIAVNTYNFIRGLRDIIKFWKHREFVLATYGIVQNKKVDLSKLQNKIIENIDDLNKKVGETEYTQMFESIYNSGHKTKVKF